MSSTFTGTLAGTLGGCIQAKCGSLAMADHCHTRSVPCQHICPHVSGEIRRTSTPECANIGTDVLHQLALTFVLPNGTPLRACIHDLLAVEIAGRTFGRGIDTDAGMDARASSDDKNCRRRTVYRSRFRHVTMAGCATVVQVGGDHDRVAAKSE